MRTRSLVAAAILASGVLIATPFAFARQRAHAFGRGEFGSGMMLGRLEHAKRALDLTDQQVSDIKTIFKSVRDQNAPYRDSLRTGRQSVLQALINNPNDLAGAQAVIDQQAAAERAMKTNMLNAASKALNVLTPEQRAKLGQFVQEKMSRRSAK